MLRTSCIFILAAVQFSCVSRVDLYSVTKAAGNTTATSTSKVEAFIIQLNKTPLLECSVQALLKPGDQLNSILIEYRDLAILPCVMTAQGGNYPVKFQMTLYNTGDDAFVISLDNVKIENGQAEEPFYAPYEISARRYQAFGNNTIAELNSALALHNPFPRNKELWLDHPVVENRIVIPPNEQLNICFTFKPLTSGRYEKKLHFTIEHQESYEVINYVLYMNYVMSRKEVIY